MANGYRITEVSDFRVTEDGASRLTEGYNIADVALAATGTVGVAGYKYMFGSSNLLAVGSRAVVGERTRAGRSFMAASGSLLNLPLLKNLGFTELTATGSLASAGLKTLYPDASLNSTGTLASEGLKILNAFITAGSDERIRITETGDTRVTEDGLDTRSTISPYGNVVIGTMVGEGDRTIFSSYPYYKQDDTWKDFLPYVKWNGAWTNNIKIYQHTNGAWKRSY